jgi:hypothetical protein
LGRAARRQVLIAEASTFFDLATRAPVTPSELRWLKITPAMAAGVMNKLWEMSDMAKVLEALGGAGRRISKVRLNPCEKFPT